jgi:hypothetical protein
MKKAVIAALGIVMLAAPALAQEKKMAAKPMAAAGSTADALTHHEQAMLEALHKKDFAGFKKMVMAGSWAIDENGPATIEDFLQSLNDPKANFSFDVVKTSDWKVAPVNATTSIVTYKLEEKGSYMGMAFPPVVYATTVWANHGGTWMAVFHQESTAAKR